MLTTEEAPAIQPFCDRLYPHWSDEIIQDNLAHLLASSILIVVLMAFGLMPVHLASKRVLAWAQSLKRIRAWALG